MVNIIQLDKNELRAALSEMMREILVSLQKESKAPVLNDRITSIKDVEVLTGLKKSVIYKLTASRNIPHSRFGKKLVFSRKELLDWVESNTVNVPNPGNEAATFLGKQARQRKGGVR